MLNHAPYGSYAVDMGQAILFWNRSAERILGFKADQVIGRRCYEVIQSLPEKGSTPVCMEGCPAIRLARNGIVPPVVHVRMRCSSDSRKLVTVTSMILDESQADEALLVHATGYVVEVQRAVGSWDTRVPGDRISGFRTATSYEIELDKIAEITATGKDENGVSQQYLNFVGLAAGGGAYSFRVTATRSTGNYLDSSLSDTVRIIENPIVRANGDSRSAPDGEGQAKIVWNRLANVTDGRYTIRTRKLFPSDHYRVGWAIWFYDVDPPEIGCESQPCFFLPAEQVIDRNPTGAVTSRLTHTREKLELGELYGIQLSYKTRSGRDTIHVFSANDVYVWPSKGLPGESGRPDRVATFPYFGRHQDKDYEYRICTETFFPDDAQRQGDWVALLEGALEQWEIATDGFIKMTPEYSDTATREYEPCTDMSILRSFLWSLVPFVDRLRDEDDALSEIRMLDVNLAEAFLVSNELASDPFKRCILGAHACVTSRTDYDDDDRGPSNYLAGVDITFNRSRFEDVPGHHESTEAADNRGRWYPRVPREIHFNTCLDRQVPRFTNLDRGYGAYSIAVHEAGHALGLSNVTDSWRYVVDALTPFVNPFQADIYHASHSSTRGSVMNYDSEVWDTFEPDCSPHPIDVAAIYALYQVPGP